VKALRRYDGWLLIGLTAGVVVMFQQPIRRLLDAVHELEVRYGLAVVPGLAILAIVLLLHAQARRHHRRLKQATNEIDERGRQRRAGDLERLLLFGQALSRATSMDHLREAVRRYMPEFVGSRSFWALIRSGGKWEAIAGGLPGAPDRPGGALEGLADRALQHGAEALNSSEGSDLEGHVCFPLATGETVGVFGVALDGEGDSDEWRRLVAAAAAMLATAARNVQLMHEVQEHGAYDGLTGCFNRTHAMKVLDAELQRARRAGMPLSVVMMDLDHFKGVNDRYGHLCGDAMLTAVGTRMREVLRNSDMKCRYGGEEFLLVLPDTPGDGAAHVAESLRREIAKLQIVWNGEPVSTTASMGVTTAAAGEIDARALIGRADGALYRAKKEGRNRVCVEAETAPPLAAEPSDPPRETTRYAAQRRRVVRTGDR